MHFCAQGGKSKRLVAVLVATAVAATDVERKMADVTDVGLTPELAKMGPQSSAARSWVSVYSSGEQVTSSQAAVMER